jgi:CheY-like chemotaxis protein/nitrogen-specific signal transduction histidine kinase
MQTEGEGLDPYCFAKVARDATRQKDPEDELRRLAEESRRKDVFLAILAHELRNPLAPIRHAAQAIRLRNQINAELRASCDLIDRQVHHLSKLVDDLLDLSRFHQGKMKLEKKVVELAFVVAQAVETYGPLIEARGHQFDVQITSEPVRLEVDPNRIAQALGNLLVNAAKYTPEGGHICLAAERHEGEVVLRVKDNGSGIAADVLPRIFDLFVQATSSSPAEAGLGLGLWLVKSFVELHGGSVSAHSEGPGRGSEFVVRLPLSDGARPPEPVRAKAPQSSPVSFRVLVVDDLRDAADSLAMLLTVWGHQVRVAYTGRSALETARELQPEIILLDLGLPDIDGYEVAARLRQEGSKSFVVALTGYGQEEDRRQTQEAGFNAHLLKPADLDALQALLANASTPR